MDYVIGIGLLLFVVAIQGLLVWHFWVAIRAR